MAEKIRVTPEKLKESAASLESTGQAIAVTTRQMLSIVSGISGHVWGGQAAIAFINKFKGLESDVNKMNKMLNEQSQHLQKIADEYRTTETVNLSSTSSLKNNVL